MKKPIFGTDGIRGCANVWPVTPDLILKIAQATGRALVNDHYAHPHKPMAVIGKDTRLSGYMIENLLTAGLISVGVDVCLLGPIPTPAVSMLTNSLRADFGIMISASHNPAEDNGIKFFDKEGYKITQDAQEKIEAMLSQEILLAKPHCLGKARRIDDACGRYIEFIKAAFPKHLTLEGLKIVVDAAHGAAYKIAPTVLWELGANVIKIGCDPDGYNINKNCGATATRLLQDTVIKEGAHCGVALDGDADRLIMVDEKGNSVDGDQLIALLARHYHKENKLTAKGVVTTVMSNIGLDRYLTHKGITLHRSGVGDRLVLEKMRKENINIGGEPSGHLILSDFVKSGDGLMAALQVLSIIQKNNKPFSELSRVFEPFPQVLQNFKGIDRLFVERDDFQMHMAYLKEKYLKEGELLVRPSGTESVVRVMAQHKDLSVLEKVLEEITYFIENNQEGLSRPLQGYGT
jgi:phosphoglucosamine mutase